MLIEGTSEGICENPKCKKYSSVMVNNLCYSCYQKTTDEYKIKKREKIIDKLLNGIFK
jgi:hypothetical protein